MFYLVFYIVASYLMYVWQKQNKGALGFWFLIPAAIAAISGVYQGIKGARAKREAQAAQNAAIRDQEGVVRTAEQRAMLGMPEVDYQRNLQNINRSTAQALSALQERRLGVAGVGNIIGRQNDAQLALDARDAELRRQNELVAMQERNRLAALKGGIAQQNIDYARALQGAGMQNIAGAAYSVGQLGGAGVFGGQNVGRSASVNANNMNTRALDNPLTSPASKISYKYNRIG